MTETGTQAQTPLTRTVAGAELPLPGMYAIDASHSAVEFVVRHLGITKVRGRFSAFNGDIEIGERPQESRVTAAGLATSPMNGWDEHLVKRAIGTDDRDDLAIALLVAVGTGAEHRAHPGRRPLTATVFADRYGQPLADDEELINDRADLSRPAFPVPPAAVSTPRLMVAMIESRT